MTRKQLRLVGRVATVLAALLILWLTLTPDPPARGGISDRVGHFVLFVVLGATSALWYATSEVARRSPRRTLAAVLLVLWMFAALTELGQEYVLDRSPDQYDWVANAIGAIVGLFAGSLVARLLLERSER